VASSFYAEEEIHEILRKGTKNDLFRNRGDQEDAEEKFTGMEEIQGIKKDRCQPLFLSLSSPYPCKKYLDFLRVSVPLR
jgi:hypothetical protein